MYQHKLSRCWSHRLFPFLLNEDVRVNRHAACSAVLVASRADVARSAPRAGAAPPLGPSRWLGPASAPPGRARPGRPSARPTPVQPAWPRRTRGSSAYRGTAPTPSLSRPRQQSEPDWSPRGRLTVPHPRKHTSRPPCSSSILEVRVKTVRPCRPASHGERYRRGRPSGHGGVAD